MENFQYRQMIVSKAVSCKNFLYLFWKNVQYQVIKGLNAAGWRCCLFKIYIYLQLMENIWRDCGTVWLSSKRFLEGVCFITVKIMSLGLWNEWFSLETAEVILAYWQVSWPIIKLNRQRANLYLQQKTEECIQSKAHANSVVLLEGPESFCSNPSLSLSFYCSCCWAAQRKLPTDAASKKTGLTTAWTVTSLSPRVFVPLPNVSFLDNVFSKNSPRPRVRPVQSCFSSSSNQDQVSGTTTSTVLKNLEPNTEYTVTVVPVYHEMEGKSQSENGKTSESGDRFVAMGRDLDFQRRTRLSQLISLNE